MSNDLFSSLSGSYDYVSSMSGLLSDYSSIKNGSYGALMKSYVNKVGNKAALNAYRETGSTTTAADTATNTSSTASTKKTSSTSKSSFLDSHLSSIGKSTQSSTTSSTKKSFLDNHLDEVLGTSDSKSTTQTTATTTTASEQAASTDTTTTTDKYAKYKSSWLDDQLKQYDKDATKTTAADTSVAYNTTV